MKLTLLASAMFVFATGAHADGYNHNQDWDTHSDFRASVERDEQTQAIVNELQQLRQQQQWDAPLLNDGR